MRYIKIFENHKLEQDLNKYNISNYVINSDGSIDVDGNVVLAGLKLSKIPFQFNKVTGDFNCANNRLTTLKGCPKEVGRDFSCGVNILNSLKYCPIKVGRGFGCNINHLTTLEGCPEEIGGSLDCSNNNLVSLKGCPIEIGGSLHCTHNRLTKLDTVASIRDDIWCDDNKIDLKNTGFMGWCGGKISDRYYNKQ